MEAADQFQDLLRRVRAGEAEAAAELVRRYEPEIRRMVRVHLTHSRLRRLLDSVDICQSVLANFFVRVAAGQFDLESPDQLFKLLVKMAHNHLINLHHKHLAQRRDLRRLQEGGPAALVGIADPHPTPSQVVAGKELLEQARLLLSEVERSLADQRAAGRDWAAIVRDLGGTPEALHKKLARAVDRVARQLGLDEVAHE